MEKYFLNCTEIQYNILKYVRPTANNFIKILEKNPEKRREDQQVISKLYMSHLPAHFMNMFICVWVLFWVGFFFVALHNL